MISNALAESGRLTKPVSTRDLIGPAALNGRLEIWKSVIQYIKNKPKILLLGNSVVDPMAEIRNTYGLGAAHCHCVYLQILLESGVSGLCIRLLFFGCTGRCIWRILKDPAKPLWIKILPGIVVSILIGDLTECFSWLRSDIIPVVPAIYLVMGLLNKYGHEDKVPI